MLRKKLLTFLDYFDNANGNENTRLMAFETMITILTIENLNS